MKRETINLIRIDMHSAVEEKRMSDPTQVLLESKFLELNKMSKKQLKGEVQMWRNLWGWTPNEVKYFTARTGTQIGVTMRNYTRHLGVLLATYWDINAIELGVYEKVYDPNSGEYYFERKIIKQSMSNIIDVQWIQERKSEAEMLAEPPEQTEDESEVNSEDG